ncbi:MAG: HYR domain-containing protein, partial [Desulfotomaculaceae bacterium]
CLNSGIELITSVTGTAPYSYRWFLNGTEITGETGSTLNIVSASGTDAGSYTVEVSNSCGAAVSAPAVLTVSTPPVITAQPASQTDCFGESVEFSVAVSGGVVPYSYAWEMRTSSGGSWNATGTDSNLLTVSDIGNSGPADGAELRVTVTDDCDNSITSSIAKLTVNEVQANFVTTTVCQDGSAAFSVSTTGSTPAGYTWFLDGNPVSNGGAYSGATTQTLTINNAQVQYAGTYSVEVTFNITQPNNNGPGVTTCQMSDDVGELIVDEGPAIVATPAEQTICPGSAINLVLSNANGTPNTTYTWTRDNTTVLTGIPASGSGEIISGTLSSLDPGAPQITTFTITATANGCVSTKTVTVTVVDDQSPVVTTGTCPTNISVGADAGICGAVVNYTPPTFDDNCDGAGLPGTLVTTGFPSGAEFPVGTTTVTYEYTDAAGNGPVTCSFDVTVIDDIYPIAVCKDITVELDAFGTVSITPEQIDNGSFDNCGIDNLSLDKTTFDCTDVGENIVILTVEDVSGNISTCTATVTVEDNIVPQAACKNITIQLDETGNATIVAADIDGGSGDNCGTVTLTASQTSFDCSNVGENTVTLTVTDENSKETTCTAIVTVEDNIAPTARCQDITVQLDASGLATITANDIDNGSSDNCGIASLDISQTDFDCSHAGSNTVTLTVTDTNGNVSTCESTVTIEDTEDPVALCQNITVQLDATGNVTITPEQIDNGSSDNCGTPTLSLDKTSFDCTELGENIVALTVTDGFGNTATCTAIVTVADDYFPVDIDASVAYIPIDCYGETTTVTITLESGGVGTLTYWLDGNSNATGIFENVPAGTYNWSITN